MPGLIIHLAVDRLSLSRISQTVYQTFFCIFLCERKELHPKPSSAFCLRRMAERNLVAQITTINPRIPSGIQFTFPSMLYSFSTLRPVQVNMFLHFSVSRVHSLLGLLIQLVAVFATLDKIFQNIGLVLVQLITFRRIGSLQSPTDPGWMSSSRLNPCLATNLSMVTSIKTLALSIGQSPTSPWFPDAD